MVKVKMFASVGHEAQPAQEMPPLNAEAFYEVVDSRRSTRIYAAEEVPEDVIERCVDAAQKALQKKQSRADFFQQLRRLQ